jgi:hypothetical protein
MGRSKTEKILPKILLETKDQTPVLSLSGTRKVVRTPTNPFETVDNGEEHVLKNIGEEFSQ